MITVALILISVGIVGILLIPVIGRLAKPEPDTETPRLYDLRQRYATSDMEIWKFERELEIILGMRHQTTVACNDQLHLSGYHHVIERQSLRDRAMQASRDLDDHAETILEWIEYSVQQSNDVIRTAVPRRVYYDPGASDGTPSLD
jgi:hypothetical protein